MNPKSVLPRGTAGRRRVTRVAGMLLVLGLCAGCGRPEDRAAFELDARLLADLVLTGGAVYTLNPQAPWAEALAIGDGRILAVGTTQEITAEYQGVTVDLGGQMVLPGFHDAHAHPIAGGLQMQQCDLMGLGSVEQILAAVADCDAELPPGEWLLGGGWNLGLFPAANPHKRLLDGISAERPIYLEGEDGHSSWANSLALQRAGISADTGDPPLGVIERDAAGEPSGTLREAAQQLMQPVLPDVTDAMRREAALQGLQVANSLGITAIIDASVSVAEFDTWRALEQEGLLSARILASVRMTPGGPAPMDSPLLDAASRDSGALLRTDSAKIFLDGVLEGETAALLEPYLDEQGRPRNGHAGMMTMPWDSLKALVGALDARGIQVHMHAIGDRAVRTGLDAIAEARQVNGDRDNRHHICHLQLVHEDDIARFAELGVAANFQALWAFPDAYITDVNLPAVGRERVERMYPIGSIQRAGGLIVGGSDWNVSSMNPLEAIEVAVTRRDPAGEVDGALNPAEAVALETMLAAYTRNAAWLMHHGAETGTLEPGKSADLVVLEHNLFDIAPEDISDVAVTLTLFRGRTVYEAPR